MKGKYDQSTTENAALKAASDFSKYLPEIIMWVTRANMFLFVYMYHSYVSIIHLIWLLITFIFDTRTAMLISVYGMIPIMTWEFMFIYGIRIPIVQDTSFYQTYAKYFDWKMEYRGVEQTLMFLTLGCFFMMISCLRVLDKQSSENQLLVFFKKRCTDERFSDLWKVGFYFMKYVQFFMLVYLFSSGYRSLNNFKNLGYMVFFVVYSAYEEIYRKTSILLLLFLSYFILGQYIFSFIYPLVVDNQLMMLTRYKWLNLFPAQNSITDPFNFSENKSMYFRVMPVVGDWIVLILLNLISQVNQMYRQKKEIARLEEDIKNSIKDRYEKLVYYYGRVDKIVKSIAIYSILIFMIYLHSTIEVNLINWMFFMLNLVNFAFIIRGSKSLEHLRQNQCTTKIIKTFSLTVLLLDILFICFIGEQEKINQPDSLDQRFKKAYPDLYSYLDVIGFRTNIMLVNQDASLSMRKRLLAYIFFFLLTIYLDYYFKQQIVIIKADESFDEEDYKKLFEYSRSKVVRNRGLDDIEYDETGANVFQKKLVYYRDDLIDYFERTRFTLPFMVYRAMKWWKIFDFIANYGHVISNCSIVYTAIYVSNSFFNVFNIFCVTMFYLLSAQIVHNKSFHNQDAAGLQSQCDIKMAELITKKYKNESFYVFLRVRTIIWNIQFTVLAMVVIAAYPMVLLDTIRQKLLEKGELPNSSYVQFVDRISFWAFMTGLYHYSHVIYVLFAMIYERQCINWLRNRFGCTHFKLQKFIELDWRREAIRDRTKWACPESCKYNIENYRKHYFSNDFDQIKQKIVENISEDKTGKLDEFGRKPQGDFVPVNVALRMKDAILFSLDLDLRNPIIVIDQQTQEKLDAWNSKQEIKAKNKAQQLKERGVEINVENEYKQFTKDFFQSGKYDYESISVLRKHKISFLERILKQNVDRKYKISFIKGMQFVLEAFIQLLLMVSIALKGNIYSLIYIIFLFKFVVTKSKTQLLVRVNAYMAILFFIQYLLYVLNLTSHTSPQDYPPGFKNYPRHINDDGDINTIPFAIPWFFHYPAFRDLRVAYLLGIGVDKDQVTNLMLDVVNLFIQSMYILAYRNPILVKTMTKVFWQFPSPENIEQWKRLDPKVKTQVKWLFSPKQLSKQQEYSKESSNYSNTSLNNAQVKISEEQYKFACEYEQQNKIDLNEMLTMYVDLKYDEIWSLEFLKKTKQEFKDLSPYYRIVKQGSQLVYLSFHIFTIFIVMLAGCMRKSIISFGYLVILLPHMKSGAEVLDQREIFQSSATDLLQEEIESLEQKLKLENESLSKKELEEQIKNKKQEQIQMIQERKEERENMSFKEKQEIKKKQAQKQWEMINIIQNRLMIYAIFDFTLQIIMQMPLFQYYPWMRYVGFRKIWSWDVESYTADQIFSYQSFMNTQGTENKRTLELMFMNLCLQILNCVIISIISLQSELFNSFGYLKYVTQSNGSMDLLMQLSDLKSKSITYVFNNKKIRQIISIQRRKETINGIIAKLKEKIIRWRRFTRTTMVNTNSDDFHKFSEQTKAELIKWSKQHFENQKTAEIENNEIADQTPKSKKVTILENNQDESLGNIQISEEDSIKIQKQLAEEFVQAKLQKARRLVRLYQWLNKTFTEQIMFKNDKNLLKNIVQQHSEGEVKIKTELERLMTTEALEIISHYFDHSSGKAELQFLLTKSKGRGNLLSMTGFDKTVKWKQLQKSWSFTRTGSILMRLVETFFYILISNTQNLIYMSMIFSMFQNCGIISLPYPLAVFGYALLEETRPRKWFWEYARNYTTGVLLFKFFFNLKFIEEAYESSPTFIFYKTLFKVGLFEYKDILSMTLYMCPEVLIISFIMLNEIKLKLLGLYVDIEQDIETVTEGIDRTLEKGNEERVKQKKMLASNMILNVYFQSYDQQKEHETKAIQEQNDAVLVQNQLSTNMKEESLEDKQRRAIAEVCNGIQKTSKEFDLDTNQDDSIFDRWVAQNVVQKTLENDSLIYIEGLRDTVQPDFISQDDFNTELQKQENWDVISACDCQEEFDSKFDNIDLRKNPKKGFFEKKPYFEKIFPSLKIQKPGYDLYGSSTIILSLTALYVFIFYNHITVDNSVFSYLKGQSSIFGGEMAMVILFIITIIILERYTNRSDTKAEVSKRLTNDLGQSSGNYFSQEDLFKRTSTARSMTVKLKTMKTSDLDIQGGAAQEFLQQMLGVNNEGGTIESSKTKITGQQKTKFIMHWFILVTSHLFVFWYLPIHGNYKLYGQPECNEEQEKYYGCKNFHKNAYLRIFYIFIVSYLVISSLQLAYGFPIHKIPSSVMQYYGVVPNIFSLIFCAIPFACEIRCVLDFTFSKTSLDVFQFWQLWQYHVELYQAKNGNESYAIKTLGSKTSRCEKCLFGCLISSILLFLLVGPFLIFSEFGGLTAPNPVLKADFDLSFVVNKTQYSNEANGQIFQWANKQEAYEMQKRIDDGTLQGIKTIHSSIPYKIYSNKNGFLRTYDKNYFDESPYSKWTETRFFEPDNIQDCMFREFSQQPWSISSDNKMQMAQDMFKALNMPQPNKVANFTLAIDFSFNRALPAEALTSTRTIYKDLNFSLYQDCKTGLEISDLILLDCTNQFNEQGFLKFKSVTFSQAYIKEIILGQTKEFSIIDREGKDFRNQKHDLQLLYFCNNEWRVRSKPKPTVIIDDDWQKLEVDPQTCQSKNGYSQEEMEVASGRSSDGSNSNSNSNTWGKLTLTLFSVLVSSSLLAAYSPATFYMSIVYLAGGIIRPIFIFSTWKGWIYEVTNPDPIIKLIEGVYMKRHEEDLAGEEECYRMLQEILRQPELFKCLTGTSLKGSTDPALDKMTEKDKQKLEHLQKLEQKGFEVKTLIDQMTGTMGMKPGEDVRDLD